MRDICYLCGEEMVPRKEYQGNESSFTVKPKLVHGEHVIQDSLYGRLKSEKILCESCGSQLSKEVDADFGKIFQSISEQFSQILASTEKNNNYIPSLKGHVILKNGEKRAVFIKGGVINPQTPFYDEPVNGEVKVYGEEKTAANYVNRAKSELKKGGFKVEELKFTIISDLQDYLELGINFSEGIKNFDHKLKMGLIKIATGFAMMNGICRTEVPNTIDVKANRLTYTDKVLPYVPCNIFETLYDQQRMVLEPTFPNHTLILYVDDFGTERKLICYVDLFSTFAFYVVLNDSYKGKDIHAVYQQSITKMEKPEIDIIDHSPKELLMVEKSLKIDPDELRDLTYTERYDFVQKRYNQFTVSYEIDLNASIEAVAGKIVNNYIAKRSNRLDHLSGIEREIVEALPNLNAIEMRLMHEEFVRIEEEDPKTLYRQSHVTSVGKDLFLASNFSALLEMQHGGMDIMNAYGHRKFKWLSYFIHNLKTRPKHQN